MTTWKVFTDSEIATILHGLRMTQSEGRIEGCTAGDCDHFDEAPALTNEQIDELCERINLDGVPAAGNAADEEDDAEYRQKARELYARDGEIEIDENAEISRLGGEGMRAVRKLELAHQRQLIRKGAFPGNLGWVVLDDTYLSKTDRGILETRRIAGPRYRHTWTDYEGAVIDPSDRWWDYRKNRAYQRAQRANR